MKSQNKKKIEPLPRKPEKGRNFTLIYSKELYQPLGYLSGKAKTYRSNLRDFLKSLLSTEGKGHWTALEILGYFSEIFDVILKNKFPPFKLGTQKNIM